MGIGRFFVGLISLGVIGFIAGAVFAWSHNLLSRR
jgi:tetrahydromethanopterin S-methyltransferase subunit F